MIPDCGLIQGNEKDVGNAIDALHITEGTNHFELSRGSCRSKRHLYVTSAVPSVPDPNGEQFGLPCTEFAVQESEYDINLWVASPRTGVNFSRRYRACPTIEFDQVEALCNPPRLSPLSSIRAARAAAAQAMVQSESSSKRQT